MDKKETKVIRFNKYSYFIKQNKEIKIDVNDNN